MSAFLSGTHCFVTVPLCRVARLDLITQPRPSRLSDAAAGHSYPRRLRVPSTCSPAELRITFPRRDIHVRFGHGKSRQLTEPARTLLGRHQHSYRTPDQYSRKYSRAVLAYSILRTAKAANQFGAIGYVTVTFLLWPSGS